MAIREDVMISEKARTMDKVIHATVRLHCDSQRAFELFTVNERLQDWLTNLAEVEPRVGGGYELFWTPEDRENNSTIGCKVTAIAPGQVLAFEWKGPLQFKGFMNDVDPLTHVVVSFTPCSDGGDSCTDVHLIHSGWRNTPEWDEARVWTERAWGVAFDALATIIGC